MNTACVVTRKSVKDPAKQTGKIERILYYASLAGSSHNTQPWRVEILNDTILRVYPDMSRMLSVVDPHARGLYISLGAFLENLYLAAAATGYDASITFHQAAESQTTFATVTLAGGGKPVTDLQELESRVSLRAPFLKEPLSSEDVFTLTSDPGVTYISMSSVEGQYIAEKTLKAYEKQSNDDAAKEELAQWMRFSNSLVKEKRDGLTTSGMGITGIAGFMVSRMYKPEDSKKQSFIEAGITKTGTQVDNCAGWLLITGESNDAEGWIYTGMKYQRVSLLCRSRMIGLHPMNQMIEEPDFEIDANRSLNVKGKIHFIARVGYVKKYPEAVSVRRVVADFTTDYRKR